MIDFMQAFEYCSQSDVETYDHTDDWLQEQQTLYNFAKYKSLDESKFGLFRKFNEHALKQVVKLQSEGALGSKVYALNLEKDKQIINWPTYPNIVASCTMKESKKPVKKV